MSALPHPVLYSFRRCPYAMRARMALLHGRRRVELREVVLRDKPQALLQASAKGTVPVLVLKEGVIDESIEVMLWALRDGGDDLDLSDLHTQVALVHQQDADFKPWLDRYKYYQRYPEHSQQEYRARAQVFLARLEARLQAHPYLFGDTPGFADLGIFPFVRQFRFVDDAWWGSAPHPALRQWLQGWLDDSKFEASMQKFAQWQPGHAPVFFGP